jgi:hypothetical protein
MITLMIGDTLEVTIKVNIDEGVRDLANDRQATAMLHAKAKEMLAAALPGYRVIRRRPDDAVRS